MKLEDHVATEEMSIEWVSECSHLNGDNPICEPCQQPLLLSAVFFGTPSWSLGWCPSCFRECLVWRIVWTLNKQSHS